MKVHPLVWVTVASCGVLVARSIYVERSLTRELGVAQAELESSTRLRATERNERNALVRVLGGIAPYEPFLVGVQVSSGEPIRLESPRDGIYYLVDPGCAACAANFPFLDSLAAEGASVIVYSRDGSEEELGRYASTSGVSLPFVADPGGFVEAITPRWATPLTLVFRAGRLVALIPGRLDRGSLAGSLDAG